MIGANPLLKLRTLYKVIGANTLLKLCTLYKVIGANTLLKLRTLYKVIGANTSSKLRILYKLSGANTFKATYTLEGDGPLGLNWYENINTIRSAIHAAYCPNVQAVARRLEGKIRGVRQPQMLRYAQGCTGGTNKKFTFHLCSMVVLQCNRSSKNGMKFLLRKHSTHCYTVSGRSKYLNVL